MRRRNRSAGAPQYGRCTPIWQVPPLEKRMLSEFASKHSIAAEEQQQLLVEVGWTLDEWEVTVAILGRLPS